MYSLLVIYGPDAFRRFTIGPKNYHILSLKPESYPHVYGGRQAERIIFLIGVTMYAVVDPKSLS
jgi:hypothetical protein